MIERLAVAAGLSGDWSGHSYCRPFFRLYPRPAGDVELLAEPNLASAQIRMGWLVARRRRHREPSAELLAAAV